MATQMATAEANTNSECFTVEVIPRMVAMAPGPNMIGMARGTKATSSALSPEPLATLPSDAPEDEGENRSKPMRMRMIYRRQSGPYSVERRKSTVSDAQRRERKMPGA